MTVTQLAALWATVSTGVAQHARMQPPPLDTHVWETVAAGRVSRFYTGDAERRVVAVGLLPFSRPVVWLSVTDDHLAENISGLEEIVLDGGWASDKTLYQRLDLPWPADDRHWVIRLSNNTALADATGVWERSWVVDNTLLESAREKTDAEAYDGAKTVTKNLGSWLFVDAGGGQTLAVYQAKVSMGGDVPDDMVDALTKSQLSGMFAGVQKNIPSVRARYGMGCSGQPGGDGRVIPCF